MAIYLDLQSEIQNTKQQLATEWISQQYKMFDITKM